MLYMMYDVQPEETGWSVAPYEGALVEKEGLGRALMARGAVNQKGPERAFLNALEAIIATDGKLPVNIMVAAEGEEELGSPHYPEIIAKYEERLRKGDAVLFPSSGQDRNGAASMAMGAKGIVSFELEARGGDGGGPQRAEIHSSLKAVVDAPAWRLVQALSTLAGLGHGGGAHAPDEYLVVEPAPGSTIAGLARMEKFYVDLLYALAGH